MAGQKEYNYGTLDSPYNGLLNRENDLTYQFGAQTPIGGFRGGTIARVLGSGNEDGTTQGQGGSVATVALKSEGNATDVWIQNFIRSVNWKPKTVGFYINGRLGYAEFANVYVSGTIVVNTGTIGGFEIGSDYIRDHLNTMGMASTVTGGDDVRFWAGDTFTNRNTAPFRVLESGILFASYAVITGGIISGGTIAPSSITYSELAYPPLNGVTDPSTAPGAIGQTYVNTALARIFMSVGTNSDSDWVLLSTVGVTRTKMVFNTVNVTENISLAIV